ncbi:MAG: hypothetical protein Fur0041_06980 [Bacteroidia bacterium]
MISVFILFMQFLWKWVDELVGKGLEWQVVVELFFYASLSMVPLALPMAVLLSSLMTFGNLAEHYELAALKSAGQSLTRIAKPLIGLVVMITVIAYLFSNFLLPYTNLKMLSTLFDIRQQKPALNIKEGIFYNEIDGYSIRINKIDKDGQGIHDIMIYDHSDQMGNTALTIADHGKMISTPDKRYLIIELVNGKTYNEIWNQENASIRKPFMRMSFSKQTVKLDLSGFSMQRTDQDLFKENHQMLSGKQLMDYIDTMHQEIAEDRVKFYPALRNAYLHKSYNYWKIHDSLKTIPAEGSCISEFDKNARLRIFDISLNNARNCKSATESKINEIEAEESSIIRFKIEYWRKYTLAIACLIMFFVGAPLGAIIRKGGLGMPVVISVFFFILFWVLSITGEKISKEGNLPAEVGMWIGCAAFVPLGIWLTIKATADSALFDTDSYVQTLRNFFVKLFRIKEK